MRVTTEVPRLTELIRPTSPSPLTTGSSRLTPSVEPLSIPTVEYQIVGERVMTDAVTGV
jgi:hypothetical protein